MIKTCKWCGKRFESKLSAQYYCTTACQAKAANERNNAINNAIKPCKQCGKLMKGRSLVRGLCNDCRKQKGLKPKSLKGNPSICNNCNVMCKWMVYHKQVEGWTAVRNDIDGAENYIVMKCPNFLKKGLKNDVRKCNDI